jgi:nitroreductase
MNETLNTIKNRRSIRKYTAEQVGEEALQAILEAGQYAPSAMNQQSWHFTVVQNAAVLQKLNEACKAAFQGSGNKAFAERAKADNFQIFYGAPTLIIVSGDAKAIAPQNDGSLVLGNMFLAAESLGVSSCWIHAMGFLFSPQQTALKSELGIPEGYVFVGAGAFGHRDGGLPDASPRNDGSVNIIR